MHILAMDSSLACIHSATSSTRVVVVLEYDIIYERILYNIMNNEYGNYELYVYHTSH